MAILFDKLPTILVLAVMVGIFMALRRHVKSARLELWIAAWVLIFAHFFVQLFEPPDGNLTPVTFLIDIGCLQLSALFFIASLTSFFEDTWLTVGLLALTGIPVMTYTAGLAYELKARWLYVGCTIILYYGSPLLVALRRKLIVDFFVWAPVAIITGTVVLVKAWHGNFDFGVLAMLTYGFILPGFLFCRRYPRLSPGVVVAAGGFVLWGAVFPV